MCGEQDYMYIYIYKNIYTYIYKKEEKEREGGIEEKEEDEIIATRFPLSD